MREKINTEQKQFLKLFWINLIIILLCYSVYLFNFHFDEDYFEAVLGIKALANTNLRNGRVIHFFLYSFFDLIHFNFIEHQFIIQLVLSIVIAYFMTRLTKRFVQLFNSYDRWTISFIGMGLLLLFTSPCFVFGWYYWVETCIGASLSLLVTLFAIDFWCRPERKRKNILFSFVLIFLSVSMYQIYIELYIGFCLTYSLLQNKFKFNKKSLIQYIIIMVMGGSASILNIIQMSLLQRFGFIYKDSRSATLSLEVIFSNLREIINAQKNIWFHMYGFLPKLFLIMYFLFLVIFGIYFVVMNKKERLSIIDYLFFFMNLATIYVMAFVPNIISGTVWLAPRTFIGIYTFLFCILVFVIYFLSHINTNKMKNRFGIILLIFTVIASIRLLQLQVNTVISNRLDQSEIESIENVIDSYEENTGIKVDTIRFAYDSNRKYNYNSVEYMAFDNNARGLAYDWCFSNMIQYYLGTDIIVENMADEKYKEYYGDSEWNYLDMNQQVHFDNNILYLAIY